MTERQARSSVLKCTTFVHPSIKRARRENLPFEIKKWKGMTSAMLFISMVSVMCVTGESVGFGEESIPLLPEPFRGGSAHKYFLDGWSENNTVKGFIQRSSRVEFRLQMVGTGIYVDAHFFKKGKEEVGGMNWAFDLYTGGSCGGGLSY